LKRHIRIVDYEFDPAKDLENIAKHRLSLGQFNGFDSLPHVVADKRIDYGEARFRAFGRIGGVGHCLVYTFRGDSTRLISFRRAP
jgi:uncharacterized protein